MHIRLKTLFLLVAPLLGSLIAAWAYALIFGLPSPPPAPHIDAADSPHGFPAWLRVTHFVNLLFMVMLVRSGLQILYDHPRLYWTVHCTPGAAWMRVTPILVPTDRLWTAKDDARYLTPWIGLPGGRHTVGMARHWHFFSAIFWVGNGLVFLVLLFGSGQWRRLLPTDWAILRDAWAVHVHYATFHLPVEPDGFYRYNPLQQLAYFGVVFVLAPMSILTGAAMSPALANRHKWYPRLFGNRQVARSIHFLLLCAYLGFVVIHVTMVVVTGLARNMNHIVMGTDDTQSMGLILGVTGIGVIVAFNVLANWLSWRFPRLIQHASRAVVTPVMRLALDHLAPKAQYRRDEVSPYFWPNGKLPTCEEWTSLVTDEFAGYQLSVGGLVENPVILSLADIKAMGLHRQVTMHNCIQGWSGIAEWGGLPLSRLVDLVKPSPEVRFVAFYSFGEGAEGGPFYDCHSIENVRHPLSLLAYEMNGQPLSQLHGAPLRLRVENQLGYKQVKWIRSIEFVAHIAGIGKGEGGYNEDHEFYGHLADI